MHGATLAFAAAAAFGSLASAANMTEWQSRSIYQVMIDRFARTDGSTTATCEEYLFCNGTWTGLLNNLDYIQGMGFTAIQISPVVKNVEQDTAVGMAYHGYWSTNLYELNEHFGTEDELKALITEIHNRDMYILVDVVVNNMAQEFNNTYPPPVDYSEFYPFNNEDYFHPYCNVTEWDNSTNYQDCWLYPYGIALADLNTDSTTVVNMFETWITELVSNYSIDGLRIDAAKHVDDAFLPQFVNASGVFALGEILTGVVSDFCRYQELNLLQGMPNYLEYYPLITAFNGGSLADLAAMRTEAQGGCNNTLSLGNFAENHDMPRFAYYNADMALAQNAMTYIMLNDGIPLVYQGQEQHFSGGDTPWNREALWLSGYNTSSELYVLAATLNKVRNNAISISGGSYVTELATTLWADDNHLCLAKGPSGSQIVFCINNKSSSGDSYQISVGGFDPSDAVVEVLSCTTSTADATGNVTMYMNAGVAKVYTLQSALNGTGLCNTTTVASASNSGGSSGAGTTTFAGGLVLAVVMGWVLTLLA